MGKIKDLTGQKFGRLTVIERAENKRRPNGRQEPRWLCRCDCTKIKIVEGRKLKSGRIRSCGCLQKEIALGRNNHGQTKTRLYTIW